MSEFSSADKAALWRAGRLSWLLHSSQYETYQKYRKWESDTQWKLSQGYELPGQFSRCYVLDCARRWGKDYLSLLVRIEDAIRTPGLLLSYGCDTAKNATEIAIPLAQQICADAPKNVRPILKMGHMGTSAGFHFSNGSVLRIVGCDRNPDALRGRHSDGVTLSEAAFIDHLEYIVTSVIMPMFLGRPKSTLFMNSTPSPIPGHPWDEKFCPVAKEYGRYARKTIEDNPLLSKNEISAAIKDAGGRESEKCKREYFVERVRSSTRTVVPEFDEQRHVKASPTPEFALGYTVIDPGVKDILAIACGYVDFERNKLVIRRDWGASNANTNEVATALKSLETEVFGPGEIGGELGLRYWAGTEFKSNPAQRFSDTDARLIIDLNSIHKVRIGAADKDGAEAALHSLRNGFHRNQIEIHPEAKLTVQHVQNAVWNKSRSSYERSDIYGHFDALDVLKYMWRHASLHLNPNPPDGIRKLKTVTRDNLFIRPEHLKTTRNNAESLQKALTPAAARRPRRGRAPARRLATR